MKFGFRHIFLGFLLFLLVTWFFIVFKSCGQNVDPNGPLSSIANAAEQTTGALEDAATKAIEVSEEAVETVVETVASQDEEQVENSDTEVIQNDPPTAAEGEVFMVIAGSYAAEKNANAIVKQLRSLGFDNSETIVFNYSEYHTVRVDSFTDYWDAKALANKLKDEYKVDALVQKRRTK